MTMELGGKAVIERCVNAFYDACTRIIVVTGAYHREVSACLAPYPKVGIQYNKDHPQGMFTSVKAGIGQVRADRFFLTPGDYPLLRADTVACMMRAGGPFLVPVYRGEAGHPVLLDRALIPAILASHAPSLRDCLRESALPRREIWVDDPGVVTDLDTMEDHRAAVKGLGSGWRAGERPPPVIEWAKRRRIDRAAWSENKKEKSI